MGEVWLGRRRLGDGSDQPVAIKLISAKAAAQPGGLERFNREARLWLTLHHANVVALYDFVRQEGEQFMVEESRVTESDKVCLAPRRGTAVSAAGAGGRARITEARVPV